MAFGSGSGGNDGQLPIAEINITPLTDVMLVLLIIAMVIAPTLAFKGKDLRLPDVEKAQEFKEEDNLLQVDAMGAYYFNQELITLEELGGAFDALVTDAGSGEVTLIIAADPTITYQQVLTLWNKATQHKIERIVLAGEVVDQHGNSLLRDEGTQTPSTSDPAVAPATPPTASDTSAGEVVP